MMNKNLKFIFGISIISYFLQGLERLPSQALFVFLKTRLHLEPSTIMYIGSITGIAWILKILIGYVSDNYLTKKIWFMSSLIGSMILCGILGMAFYPLAVVVAMLTITSTCSAVRDVNTDGIACIEGKRSNLTGKIQALQWGSITVASLIVGLLGGFIAQNLDYRVAYLGLIPLYMIAGWFIWQYKEKKACRKKTTIIATISKYKVLWHDKRFVYTCMFLFFYCYAPSFGTPLAFIQRDVFHFSEIYIGIMGAIFAICEIVGAYIYYRLCNKINLQKWLVISVFIGAITTLCYLYYTPVTIWVYGIAFAVVGMFVHLILMDTMARASLKGLEATSFAMLCGIHNLAGTASSLLGAYLFPKIGLQPLIVISSLTSFVCLFWVSRLKIDKHNISCKVTTCVH